MVCPPAAPRKQLDGSAHADVNCGPTCAAMALDHASCGKVTALPEGVRQHGAMGSGPTGFDDLKSGIATYAPEFAAAGFAAPNLIRLGYIDLPTFRSTLVRKDAFHIITVDYEVVVDNPDTSFRGDMYRGNHFIACRMLYKKRADGAFVRIKPRDLARAQQATIDALWTEVLDPLADGRSSGHLHGRAPQAPQKWPLSLVWAAGDKFYDNGLLDGKAAVAVIFRAEAA